MTSSDRDQPHGLGMEDEREQPLEGDIEREAAREGDMEGEPANGEPLEEVMASPGAPEEAEEWDDVTEASVESFPASDAPGWIRED